VDTIDKIKYGELHIYYPFRLDTKLSFEKVCGMLCNSTITYSADYAEMVNRKMQGELQQRTENLMKEYPGVSFNIQAPSVSVRNRYLKKSIKEKYQFFDGGYVIKILPTDNIARFEILPNESSLLDKKNETICSDEDFNKKYYGVDYVSAQERFLLLPVKVRLVSGLEVWVQVTLILFMNKLGVLKVEIPLADVGWSYLESGDNSKLIESYEYCGCKKVLQEAESIYDLARGYFREIVRTTKIKIESYNNSITNIVLVDYKNVPEQLDRLNVDFQTELYRTLCAPVPNMPYMTFDEVAKKFVEEHKLGSQALAYIINPMGSLISLGDKNFLNDVRSMLKESDDETNIVNNSNEVAANLLCRNIEFVLLTVLLKRTNDCWSIFHEKKRDMTHTLLQRIYYENVVFINSLQSSCFGSAKEQLAFVEEKMHLYLCPDITSTTQSALEKIVEDEIEIKRERESSLISVMGLFLTIIFGLPSIDECNSLLCAILNKTYNAMVSVGIWIAVIIILFLIVFGFKALRRKQTQ